MSMREARPECGSPRFKKNGHIHNGKQNHQGQSCGRQFVVDVAKRVIDAAPHSVVEHLFCEKISLHGICRALGVSIHGLRDFLGARFIAAPDHLHVQPIASSWDIILRCLEVEAEELRSFGQKKATAQWLWIAMDKQTRHISVFSVGDRSRDRAKQVWQNIPEVDREQATFSPDQYAAYLGVIPPGQHKFVTKHARTTSHSERFDNTRRQRISRLVRSTLVFSKNVVNHVSAIRYFLCYYNLTRTALLV